MSAVIEAEPVDDGAVARQSEYTRARVAELRQRRYCADLGEAAAKSQDGIGYARVLIETGRDSNGVRQR